MSARSWQFAWGEPEAGQFVGLAGRMLSRIFVTTHSGIKDDGGVQVVFEGVDRACSVDLEHSSRAMSSSNDIGVRRWDRMLCR